MKSDSASATARSVAAHRLEYERVPAPYGDPAADEALARDVADGTASRPGRMHEYLRARTAFFDRVVVTALDRGIRQVVVGAAGYDGRAFRYGKPGVRWFEVDHPATQADKRARLDRLGLPAAHIAFVAADFTADPVAESLRAAGLDPAEPAVFLFEGVAVYLDNAVTERVLAQFRQVTPPGSVLAISVSTSAGGAASERFRQHVAALGEPARSALPADEARALLARAGWRLDDTDGPRRARRQTAGLLVARATDDARPIRSLAIGRASGGPGVRGCPPGKHSGSPKGSSPRASRAERIIAPPPAPVAPPAPGERHSHPAGGVSMALSSGGKPLSALLSHAVVAYTIEFDNAFEHRMPHRSANHGLSPGAPADAPWLPSLAMWETCVRHVPDEGITVADLRRAARTGTNLDGMRRWGFVTLTSPSGQVAGRSGRAFGHPKVTGRTVVRLTDWGRRAHALWSGLDREIEDRWRARLGADTVMALIGALAPVASGLDRSLPDCLPILGHGMFALPDSAPDERHFHTAIGVSTALSSAGEGSEAPGAAPDLPLRALLSRVLLGFAAEYERESTVSLAISANHLRVLTAEGVRARDVPALSGVSKEAVAMALTWLKASGLAVEEPDPAARRGKIVRLTADGDAARARYAGRVAEVEAAWREKFGAPAITALRESLEGISGRLAEGLTPYPEGWRTREARRSVLPDYPMVLHRGGYPDGA
jgi:methyltransferase (TIGR00027 family)